MTPALAKPIFLSVPEVSTFTVINLALVVLTTALLLALVAGAPRRLLRPALLLAVITHLLYQWPLVLLAGPIESSLQSPWVLCAYVHGAVLALLAWAWLSRKLDVPAGGDPAPAFSAGEIAFPVAVVIGLSAVYLGRVPAHCTALYSLVMDPHMTLLAREFSIKLVGSSMATYSFGAVANAVAPVVITISFLLLWSGLRQRRILQVLVWPVIGFLSVALVLLSGTKGLLVPAMLMLVISSYLWNRRWWTRVLAVVASMAFLGGSVVMFDLVKERDAQAGSNYDFASCTVELNVCPASLELMESLGKRDMSLGLPKSLVKRLDERLICACNPNLGPGECKRVQPIRISRARPAHAEGEMLQEQVKRGFTLLEAILNRALVIPMQVAGWHFMYVETEPNPGMAVLPFARRLLGFSVNAPERVYQKYGVIYSDGDRTSTSTAPTGFLLTYPAYLGLYGLLLGVGLVIIFDVLVTALLRQLRPGLLPIAAGLVAGVCLNFAVSDFVTVLISHGGVAAVGLLAGYVLLARWRQRRNPADGRHA